MTPTHDPVPTAKLLVGVDGGGTKTEAVVGFREAAGELRVLGVGTAGPANLQTLTAEGAWEQCQLAIDRAFAGLGGTPDRLRAVAFAMAGEGSPPHRQAFINVLEASGRIEQFVVTHDARPLIAGGTPHDCGIALIAGTGSFAFCRTESGIEDRCGGWGYLYGDEGSGYALAVAGLRAAVSADDGRGPSTALVAAFAERLGEPDIRRWLASLRQWPPEKVAATAGVVCRVAAEGDPVAASLIDRTAAELARHLITLWQRQFADRAVDIVLTGGLLIAEEPIRQRTMDEFARLGGRGGGWRVIARPVETVPYLLS